jgi:hypothetical protein
MGAQPTWRLIRKNETTKKWENVGAAWDRDDQKSFSVVIELVRGGEKVKCLMVKNEPKQEKVADEQWKQVQEAAVSDDSIPF